MNEYDRTCILYVKWMDNALVAWLVQGGILTNDQPGEYFRNCCFMNQMEKISTSNPTVLPEYMSTYLHVIISIHHFIGRNFYDKNMEQKLKLIFHCYPIFYLSWDILPHSLCNKYLCRYNIPIPICTTSTTYLRQ